MNVKDKIISLKQWKQRKEIINQLNQFGWEATGIDLVDIDDPFFFYITEPLDTQFMAMGCARTEDLKELIDGKVTQYGTSTEISDAAGAISLSMINKTIPRDQEHLELLIMSHMINFATTKTAKFALEHSEKFRHFGVIIYKNEKSKLENYTMRPMAMFSKEKFMKPETVTKIMALHVMEDYKKHPEYFIGVDIDEALISIVKDYPNLLDELFGRGK